MSDRPVQKVYIRKIRTGKQRRLFVLNLFFTLSLGSAVASFVALYLAYRVMAFGLPKLDTLADYRPNIVSTVSDIKGRPMGEFKYENQSRYVVPVESVPPLMVDAFVAVEDEHFFEHKGLDYAGIVRAAYENIRRGAITQGASTITMQVCRSMLLTPEKTIARKIKEAILAQRIEQRFSKKEILYLYLNQIYFGHGAYGVEAAARNYFDKSAGDLSLGEIALIVGLPQAPSRFNPYADMETALGRRMHVLNRMVEVGKIDKATADAAAGEPVRLAAVRDINKEVAPYFTEYVRQYCMKKYGVDTVLKEGLRITTNCDLDMQAAAVNALQTGLADLARRQGFTGPEKRISPAEFKEYSEFLVKSRRPGPVREGQRLKGLVVSSAEHQAVVDVGGDRVTIAPDGMKWVEKIRRKNQPAILGPFSRVDEVVKSGDVIWVRVQSAKAKTCELDAAPQSQGAILVMNPDTREVRAMAGGYSFEDSEFNRVLQAHRQPGSSFKPIVYSAALLAGLTPATHFMDTAIVFADGWRPRNYSGSFAGEMTLRQAITKSINTVTVRVAQAIGPNYIERFARRLGLRSLAGSDLSMALGSYEVIPMELFNAYAVFASGGRHADPIFIRGILDRDGNVLEENLLSDQTELAPPLENVPDLRSKSKQSALSEGESDLPFQEDSPAREQFLDDFQITGKIKRLIEKAHNKPADLKEIPIPTFKRDAEGRIIGRQILGKETAFLITSMLHSVAASGTGARSNVLGKTVAGKTGTTNRNIDAWFIGFSPDILCGVWVGNDAGSKPLGQGETGSQAALPIWIKLMQYALAGVPDKPFPVPPGVETALVDPKTGLLAYEGEPDAYYEYFLPGTVPTETAPSPDKPNPKQFFQMDF